MNTRKIFGLVGIVVFSFFFFAFHTASAKDVINLKLATFSGGTNPVHQVIKWWADELDKRSNGRVKIKIYETGSLCKGTEMLDATKTGFTDISQLTPDYSPSQLVVSGIPHRPFSMVRADRFVFAFHEFAKIKQFREEMDSNNLVFLWFQCSGNYNLMGKKPVRNLADLKGLKIRVTGAYAELLKAFGATPVFCTQPETYDAVSKGVVDVALGAGHHWMHAAKIYEASKNGYYSINMDLGRPYIFYAMNKDRYNSLPDEIKGLMDEIKVEIPRKHHQTAFSEELDKKYLKIFEEHNIQIVKFASEDRTPMIKKEKEHRDTWISDWEAKGRKIREAANTWDKIMADVIKKYPHGL